ncbi:LIM domain-binding protein 2 [Dufourea novaeangliae]|uniref:LIM domain-binding protein 2 n=1 Tax=Dufourea novaeangliae TaxID=178035 RepID=A0A154PK00_DUFNO|nr:LIM domain-binding protein 2 [Dufourea novaeangliae]
MPPGSPFGPGHPMTGPIGPGHPAMMGPGGPVDRMDQGTNGPSVSNGNGLNSGHNLVGTNNTGQQVINNTSGLGVNTTSGATTNPLQAMASAAASLTQLNNMANGPLPPLAATGPTGPPSLPPPQPATTPTHGGPPTPHAGGPHLNGASPSPHPMPPHGIMTGSPHAPHPHMGGGGPSPHPHHPGPHMVGSPHHPGPHPMGPAAGMMGPAGMQPQGAPGMCGPGPAGPMGPHPHPQGPGVPGQPHMHNDPFYCSPFGSHYFRSLPVPRRHTPYFGQPDYRLYELNKRLQQRTEESDNLWWDAFATEFFEDDATLTLTFCLEDGPKRYTIGRTLIPRYFRSIFEGGVTELYYNLKHPKESFHNTSITLDCDHCVMVTHHGKPMFTKVCTEGRLILEFTFDDLMRIKSWHMSVRTHKELVPRTVVGMQQDPTMLEQLSKNITRQGITNSTLNYLRLCVILEPMQELMSRHKAYALSPRDCLKTTLFQKWQRMVAPPGKRESQRPASKRRKRKGSTSGPGNNAPPAPSKKRSPGPNFALASQDVMVVGEPSLMGGDFGDEDERLITRLENTQYDATNSLDPHRNGKVVRANGVRLFQGVQGGQGGGSGGVQGSQDASQQQQDKKSPARGENPNLPGAYMASSAVAAAAAAGATAGRLASSHHIGVHPSSFGCHQAVGGGGLGLSSGHTHAEQHLQLGHAAAAAAAAASMGMESSELVAVAHYQAQQLQRQLLAEQSGGPAGTMLPPGVQPTGGGLTQPPLLQQGQQPPHTQGQDPLQSLMQQLICLQHIEYFLAQRGHK